MTYALLFLWKKYAYIVLMSLANVLLVDSMFLPCFVLCTAHDLWPSSSLVWLLFLSASHLEFQSHFCAQCFSLDRNCYSQNSWFWCFVHRALTHFIRFPLSSGSIPFEIAVAMGFGVIGGFAWKVHHWGEIKKSESAWKALEAAAANKQ